MTAVVYDLRFPINIRYPYCVDTFEILWCGMLTDAP